MRKHEYFAGTAIVGLFVGAVCAIPIPVYAQSTSLQASNTETVVVTADKREENIQEVPMAVTAVSGDTLLASNQTRIQDFFSTIPGLDWSPTGSQEVNTLAIRGISTGSGTNATAGVTVDGVGYGSTFGNVIPELDPSELERVEVLRGPQGTLYGASSMGGLINYVTKNPSFTGFSATVTAGIESVSNGSEPGLSLRGAANIPLTDDLAVRFSAFTRQDAGYVDDALRGINGINQAQANGGHLAALWNLTDTMSLKLSATVEATKTNGSPDVNQGPGYAYGIAGTQPEYYPGIYSTGLGDLQQAYYPGIDGFRGLGGTMKTVQTYNATFSAKIGDVALTSVVAYNQDNYRDTWDFTPEFGPTTAAQPGFGGVSGSPVVDSFGTRRLNEETRLTGTLFESFDWLLGEYYNTEHQTHFENIYAESLAGAITGTWANWNNPYSLTEAAVFGDVTYHFTDRLSLEIGGRLSHVKTEIDTSDNAGPIEDLFYGTDPVITPASSTAANVFTYMASPKFDLTPDVMVYGRIATGYRPGQVNVGALPGEPSGSSPDRTTNYEVGLKGDFFDHLISVDTSLYYIDWKSIQVFVLLPSGFGYEGNGAGAKSEGVEFATTIRPFTGTTVSGWVDYDYAALTQAFPPDNGYGVVGTRLPYSPEWSGNISIQQNFPLTSDLDGFVGVQASFVGERYGQFAPDATSYRQVYPYYTQVNLRAGIDYQSWSANFYVTNIGDERGLLGGGVGDYPPIGYQYIQPRTIGMNVTKNF